MNFAKYRVQLSTEKKYSSKYEYKYEYEYSIPGHAPGVGLWGAQGVKFFFSNIVMWHIKSTGITSRTECNKKHSHVAYQIDGDNE